MRTKNFAINLLLVVVSTIFTLCVVESIFLLLDTPRQQLEVSMSEKEAIFQGHEYFNEYHPILGMTGQRNLKTQILTHNSQGNRNPESSMKVLSNGRRIVMLGDSNTWGFGIGDKETKASQLEQILNASQADVQFNVINLGVTGYGIGQSYLKFLIEGVKLKPDWVVLEYFHLNDTLETSSDSYWGVPKPRFFSSTDKLCLRNVPVPLVKGWSNFHLFQTSPQLDGQESSTVWGIPVSSSATLRFFAKRSIRTELASMIQTFSEGSLPKDLPNTSVKKINSYLSCRHSTPRELDRYELTTNVLLELKQAVEEVGANFLVIFTPTAGDYKSDNLGKDYIRFLDHLRDKGIETIDPWPHFHSKGFSAQQIYLGQATDDHYSPFGQRQAASLIAERILSTTD